MTPLSTPSALRISASTPSERIGVEWLLGQRPRGLVQQRQRLVAPLEVARLFGHLLLQGTVQPREVIDHEVERLTELADLVGPRARGPHSEVAGADRLAASTSRAMGWNTSTFSRKSAATTSIIITKKPSPAPAATTGCGSPDRSRSGAPACRPCRRSAAPSFRNSARSLSSSIARRASGLMRRFPVHGRCAE